MIGEELILEQILHLTEDLISIRSLSGQEQQAIAFFEQLALSWDLQVVRIPVEPGRDNLLISQGQPTRLLTTHIDVVSGPEVLFSPRRGKDRISGRGACDAKGILATMAVALRERVRLGDDNIGLLVVVGEEVNGAGAKAAVTSELLDPVRYLINGEPTEGKLICGHKGAIRLHLQFSGRAAHSGYPELGIDANLKLIELANCLLSLDLGAHPVLGKGTINIGEIRGGIGSNVVSPAAELVAMIRTVVRHEELVEAVKEVVAGRADLLYLDHFPPVELNLLPGFESGIVNYGSDLAYFCKLNAQCYLYGPGTIHVAHTDEEYVLYEDLVAAYRGYNLLLDQLKV